MPTNRPIFCDDRRHSRLFLKMFKLPDVTVLSSRLFQLLWMMKMSNWILAVRVLLEKVDKFCCLEEMLNADGGCDLAVAARVR